MTKHIQWDNNFHKKDLIFLKRRELAVSSAPTKVGYIIMMTSDKAGLEQRVWKRTQPQQTRCGSAEAYGWTSCAIESWNRSFLPKTLGWRYLRLVVSSLREDVPKKIASWRWTGRIMTDARELHLSLNLVKLVSNRQRNGKKKARWFTLLQSTLPVREIAGRSNR